MAVTRYVLYLSFFYRNLYQIGNGQCFNIAVVFAGSVVKEMHVFLFMPQMYEQNLQRPNNPQIRGLGKLPLVRVRMRPVKSMLFAGNHFCVVMLCLNG